MPIPSFADWEEQFKKRSAYVSGSPPHMKAVHAVLATFDGVALSRGSHELLRRNALWACYQASHAPDPSEDHPARERRKTREARRALQGHLEEVSNVLAFIERHNDLARTAIEYGSAGRKAKTAELNELRRLLKDYLAGHEEVRDADHPAHVSLSDFLYGPFEFWIPIEKWHFKAKEINQLGLMFHLIYLFRHFTCSKLPGNAEARLIGWELEFHGYMLKCGRPHTELVAPLVNATFKKTKYSPQDVRYRVRELTKAKTKGSRYVNSPKFLGWSLPK